MKRLVIAIDCDDVLVPSTPFIIETYNRTYGTDISLDTAHDHGVDQWAAKTKIEVIDRISKIQSSDALKPSDETIRVVTGLAKHHELHLITARPTQVELVTLELMNRYFPGVFASMEHVGHEGSKGEVCARIHADVLIDDNLRHLVDALKHGVTLPIWFGDYPWQKEGTPGGVLRCKNWSEVEAGIE